MKQQLFRMVWVTLAIILCAAPTLAQQTSATTPAAPSISNEKAADSPESIASKPLTVEQPGMNAQNGSTSGTIAPKMLGPKPNPWAGVDRRPTVQKLERANVWNGDLRTLPQVKQELREKLKKQKVMPAPQMREGTGVLSSAPSVSAPNVPATAAPAPAPTTSFAGLDFDTWGTGFPPDTVGDVGPNHYIQAINTAVGIYDKETGDELAAFSFNTLMSQGNFGNLCDTANSGDPVVLYDSFEDRWILTDFAFEMDGSGNVTPQESYECYAVSKTGDPVSGGWYFYYTLAPGGFADYPKLGVWHDGIYMSANMFTYTAPQTFQGTRVWALNKQQMYAGESSVQVVTFAGPSDDFTILPSNARLQTGTPPAGRPNYFVSTWNFLNALSVYKMSVDWDNTSNSTFTGPETPINATSWPNAAVANAPSSGGNSLDVLHIRAMMQNQYTNISGVESLWNVHTVRRGDTSGFAAPRFYQLTVTGGTVAATTTQGATFDPDGSNVMHRFMPSLAVDRAGNLAIGYSTSSSTTKPAIKYAGRLSTDPVNTFSQAEQVLHQGTGTQTGNCGGAACARWGDYSAMSLDPDGCTFWYTNEYYDTDGMDYQTRVGSFSYPSCTPVGAGGTVSGTVTSSTSDPIAGATVALGSRTTTTDANGNYSFTSIPAGTYPELTASFAGYSSVTVTAVVVTNGGVADHDFTLTAAATSGCFTDTAQADFTGGVAVDCDLSDVPGSIVLSNDPVLDQQNTTFANSGFGISTTAWAGQTFIPALSGKLEKADLYLFCSGCSGSNPNLTVAIRATSSGVPTGADLATATITGFTSGSGAWYTANFSSPLTVTAGTQYAVIVRPNSAPTGTYAYICSCNSGGVGGSNPYANGQRVVSGNSGSTWSTDASLDAAGGRDLGFKIYVNTGYRSSGTFTSTLKDANPLSAATAEWGNITWAATLPGSAGVTDVKVQVAASNNSAGPFSYVGPDGTAATYFTSGASLAQFNGKRYLKYQLTLTTSDSTLTPQVDSVSACYDNAEAVTALAVDAVTTTYGGGAVTLTATLTDGGVGVAGKSVTFSVNGSSVGSATTDGSGVATLASVSLAGINAGTYATGISASFAGDSEYASSSDTAALTINKATLTVDADDKAKTYGAADPANTATITGFVNSETSSVVTGSAAFAVTGTSGTGRPFGTYTITPSLGTLAATNYSFTFTTGTLTVNKATLTVDADDKAKTYGDADPANTATITGFVNSETVSVVTGSASFAVTGTAGTGRPFGTYTITPSAGTLAATNYSFTFTTGTLTVNKKGLTVTADNKSKTYGDADPANTATITGFVNSETVSVVSGAASFSVTGTAGTGRPFGTYTITPSAGTLAATNYSFATFNTGTLTVNKAALTITADNKARIYGAANPTFTASYTGLVNSETAAALDTPVVLATTADATSPVGGYTITASGAADANYTITHVNGTLTVGAASLVVTTNNKNRSYGAANPTLDGSLATVLNGDGITAIYSTTAAVDSAPGDYAITATLNDPNGKLGNYSVTNNGGTLTVNKANVTASVAPASANYGETFNVTATVASSTSGTPTGSVTFLRNSADVGTVALDGSGNASISVSGLNAATYTYSVTYSGDANFNTGTSNDAAVTINKVTPTVLLVSDVNPVPAGTLSSFTVTVSSGAGTPTGTVQVFAGPNFMLMELSGGTGSAGTLLDFGTHDVYAVYSGDTNFNTVTTGTFSQVVGYPVPVLTGFSPARVNADEGQFTLTVRGEQFMEGAVVRWDGADLATTFVSDTELTAVVPANMAETVGIADVIVFHPTPNGGSSDEMQFAIDTESTIAPEITVNGEITVAPGQSGSVTVTVEVPEDMDELPEIEATCLNLPAGATCSFNDATRTVTISTSAETPEGSYTVTVVFRPANQANSLPAKVAPWLLLPMFGFVLVGLPKRNRRKALLMMTTALLLTAMFTACGSDRGSRLGEPEPEDIDFQASVEVVLNVESQN